MEASTKQKKWRHIYPYRCSGCGKKRMALIHGRAVGELCRVCQPVIPHKDQASLFDTSISSPVSEDSHSQPSGPSEASSISSATTTPSRKPSSKSTGPKRRSTRTSAALLPTPTVNGNYNRKGASKESGNGLATSISSREAFPANHSALRDKGKVRKTIAISGRKCYESSESSIRAGSSVRMLVASLLGAEAWYSSKSTLIWKLRDTKSKRLLYQLQVSALPTGEIGSGLSPTPLASEVAKAQKKFGRGNPSLSGILEGFTSTLIPTPVAHDDNKSPAAHMAMKARMKGGPRYKPTSLQVVMKMLPTPRATEPMGGVVKVDRTPRGWERTGKNGVTHRAKTKDVIGTETGLRLQPSFVEWMMGYPDDWTAIPDSRLLEMRSSRRSQRKS